METIEDFTNEHLDRVFPSEEVMVDAGKIVAINRAAKAFAESICQTVPWSVDRERAILLIREAAMWARDALLTYEPPSIQPGDEIETASGHKIRFRGLK